LRIKNGILSEFTAIPEQRYCKFEKKQLFLLYPNIDYIAQSFVGRLNRLPNGHVSVTRTVERNEESLHSANKNTSRNS